MEFHRVNLVKYDYLVVDCGYINRLYKHIDNIKEQTMCEGEGGGNDHALMFFVDYDYDPRTDKCTYDCQSHQEDTDHVYDALLDLIRKKKLGNIQAVCFKQTDLDIDLVEMLIEYQHCGCFGNYPCRVASFKTETGKTVLYKKFNTESG